MFDHIGLRVRDLPAAVAFYRAALAPLGMVPGPQGDDHAGFGPPGHPGLWLHLWAGPAGTGVHVCFSASDRAAVRAFHAAAMAAGGRDNGAPGLRPQYTPTYYGAFVIDPDGNNVEAVCFGS